MLAEIRKNPLTSTIPFIFLTAQAKREDVRQGMGLGADDYLTKPFSIPELLDAVQARLDRRALVLKEQENKLNELRGDISYMLPHELRTPLQTILGYCDFLLENDDSLDAETLRLMIESIQRGGLRLEHLIENYLIYAQIELLKGEDKRRINLDMAMTGYPDVIIRNCAREKDHQLGREGDLILNLTGDCDLPLSQENFSKVVEELIDNAFKFSKQGNAVQVDTSHDDRHYHLRVQDTGRGMTDEQIASIGAFRQFKRRIYEQQGNGLGLAIALGLVELYGGSLTVTSAPGQSTLVAVTLPITVPGNTVDG
jgi:signal transduction histidine kinase